MPPEATKAKFEEIIRPGPRKRFFHLISFMMFAFIGWHAYESPWLSTPYHLLEITSTVLFLLWVFYIGFQALPGSSFLGVSAEGFTICSNYRKRFHPWSSVKTIGVTEYKAKVTPDKHRRLRWEFEALFKIAFGDVLMVGIDYVPDPCGKAAGLEKRAFTKGWFGYEEVIVDSFGRRADDVAEMLNRFMNRHKS